MTDRPIIFSAPMICALLDGRKTQTRRVMKPQPSARAKGCYRRPDGSWVWLDAHRENNGAGYSGTRLDDRHFFTPYAPGDRLWARERWSGEHWLGEVKPSERLFAGNPSRLVPLIPETWYWADGNPDHGDWENPRPSIHMPRWASRLTLTVSDVRVQRLQEVSEEDAWAEGCKPDTLCDDHGNPFPSEEPHPAGGTIGWDCARDWFADLWEGLHGAGAWDANPWVVALTFTVHRQNIDQLGRRCPNCGREDSWYPDGVPTGATTIQNGIRVGQLRIHEAAGHCLACNHEVPK